MYPLLRISVCFYFSLSFSQHFWRSKRISQLLVCCKWQPSSLWQLIKLAIKFRSNPPTLLKSCETLKIPSGLDSNQWPEAPSRESEQPLDVLVVWKLIIDHSPDIYISRLISWISQRCASSQLRERDVKGRGDDMGFGGYLRCRQARHIVSHVSLVRRTTPFLALQLHRPL